MVSCHLRLAGGRAGWPGALAHQSRAVCHRGGRQPRGTSVLRGEILGTLEEPPGEPDIAWFTRVLAGAAPPAGVRAEPSSASQAATLCSFVASLSSGDAYLLSRGSDGVGIPLADLVHGKAGRQRKAAAPAPPP